MSIARNEGIAVSILQGLNPEQLDAVRYTGGSLLIIAGPGTGKTRVLVHRMAFLIDEGHAKGGDILAMTFTNQAAGEMKDRLGPLLSGNIQGEVKGEGPCTNPGHAHHKIISGSLPRLGTFHSWALGFLREELGTNALTPIDETGAFGVFREAAAGAGLGSGGLKGLFEAVLRVKESWPVDFAGDGRLASAFDAYQALMRKEGLWDYDDLILEALRLLKNPDVMRRFGGKIRYVFVDEFQDINKIQYSLIAEMAGAGLEITAIGDPMQAVYGFRGADPALIGRFSVDFGVKTITLGTAYRSPQTFLDAASAVATVSSAGQGLRSVKGRGPKLVFKTFKDEASEAAWIAGAIESMVGALSLDSINASVGTGQMRSLSDVGVLFRVNAIGGPIAKALAQRGIPCRQTGSSAADTERIKAFIDMWDAVDGVIAGRDIARVLRPYGKDGQRFLMFAAGLAGKDGFERFSAIAGFLGIETGSPRLKALGRAVSNNPGLHPSLLLRDDRELFEIGVEAVALLSIHASKGLEFPIVFMAGCEDGVLPWVNGDMPEEERLFYVGLTRASERLFLCFSENRRASLGKGGLLKSPFLSKIPCELISNEAEDGRRCRRPRQKTLF